MFHFIKLGSPLPLGCHHRKLIFLMVKPGRGARGVWIGLSGFGMRLGDLAAIKLPLEILLSSLVSPRFFGPDRLLGGWCPFMVLH